MFQTPTDESGGAIPVISIASLLGVGNDAVLSKTPEAIQTINQIRNALETVGFFYVVDCIQEEEKLRYLEESKRFFQLPPEEKKRIERKDAVGSNGYVAIGVENLDDSNPDLIDYKEAMDVCASDPHPLYKSNQWPSEDLLPNWKNTMLEDLLAKLGKIGDILVKAFALAMGEEESFFDRWYAKEQSTLIRHIRYPPRKDDGTIGCGAHSDYGVLTLLIQDDVGGLQVLINGEWIEATPKKGTIVVNVGDCMEFLTNGKFKATKHRVINNSTTRERYALGIFYEPCMEMDISPCSNYKSIPDPFPQRPTSYGKHLQYRLSSTYLVS